MVWGFVKLDNDCKTCAKCRMQELLLCTVNAVIQSCVSPENQTKKKKAWQSHFYRPKLCLTPPLSIWWWSLWGRVAFIMLARRSLLLSCGYHSNPKTPAGGRGGVCVSLWTPFVIMGTDDLCAAPLMCSSAPFVPFPSVRPCWCYDLSYFHWF